MQNIINKTNVMELFSSKSFAVSGLMFKSLTYFKAIFVSSVRVGVQFSFSPCGYPVFPTPFIEETVLYSLYIVGSFVIE